MILFIAGLLTKFFGIDLQKAQRIVVWVFIGLGIVALVVVFGLVYRSCSKTPTLNEVEIQRGEQAVKDRNDKELRDILTNSDVREKQIEVNVATARAETATAVQEAKEKYANMNTDELAAELEKRK